MEPNETMVEDVETTAAEDDALPESIVEEEQDESESLESILTGEEEEQDEGKPEEEEAKKDSQSTSEPGWIRKRVDKAVSKAIAETEARMRAEFDAQMAPIRERMLEEKARELVASGSVKTIETARELVRYREGMPAAPTTQQQEQPRNANGQYTAKDDPAVTAKVNMLRHQANTIRTRQGLDVIKEFTDNPEIKQKVISGEMDFYDVADYMASRKGGKKTPPAPMRSPNGASGAERTAIDNMSDEQFERLEKRISQGARYTLR